MGYKDTLGPDRHAQQIRYTIKKQLRNSWFDILFVWNLQIYIKTVFILLYSIKSSR